MGYPVLSFPYQVPRGALKTHQPTPDTPSDLRRRLAQEMDLPSDSDDDDRDGRDAVDEVARRAAARKKQQAVAQRAELKRLLGRLDRPSGGASIADVAAAARSGVTWTG